MTRGKPMTAKQSALDALKRNYLDACLRPSKWDPGHPCSGVPMECIPQPEPDGSLHVTAWVALERRKAAR